MTPLLEFVPNFSEGKNRATVDALVAAMTAVAGVKCLGAELDANHNRAVVTLAGPAPAIAEAAFRGAKEAMARIDLRTHKGEHKRMGAMDVCPFVPLAGASMRDAVATAEVVGARIGAELGLPVFLYAAVRLDQTSFTFRPLRTEWMREQVKRIEGAAFIQTPDRPRTEGGVVVRDVDSMKKLLRAALASTDAFEKGETYTRQK